MTAPLRASDPIVVDVALGDRRYDIVIGRGQLASLGARIATLRPGAKLAIVSDVSLAEKKNEKKRQTRMATSESQSSVNID